jgi:hypothetical protein
LRNFLGELLGRLLRGREDFGTRGRGWILGFKLLCLIIVGISWLMIVFLFDYILGDFDDRYKFVGDKT